MPIRPDLQVFETLPVPIAIVGGDEVIFANTCLASFLGVPAASLIGARSRSLLDRFIAPGDASWLRRLDDARRGQVDVHEALWVRFRDDSGEEREIRIRVSPMPGGSGEHICLLLDASADAIARRLSEALADAAAAFMRCRDESSVLAEARAILQRQGLLVDVFLWQARELRFGRDLLEPSSRATIERITGQPLEAMRMRIADVPRLQELFAKGRPIFEQGARVSPEGFGAAAALARELLVSDRCFIGPIVLEDGPFGVLFAQGDALTPATAATLDLFVRHIAAALENARHHKRAAQRLGEFVQLQKELVAQERAGAIGDAAAVLAHEVRNPLGAILNAVALLKRATGKIPTDELLDMIEEEAERIDSLIADLLDLARPLDPRVRRVELALVVQRAIEATQGGDVQILLETLEGGADDGISADPHLLQVAVENLVRNAVQASPPGGRVLIRIGGDEVHGLVVIEDEGTGVAVPDAARIFEPFFTTQQAGTGLGLAVVKRVAEVHGGNVAVFPRAAGGSTFELRLPRCRA